MKKTLAAVAVLGAFAGSALAADVTLYGRVDLGLQYVHQDNKGVKTDNWGLQSGNATGSRFGIKGQEEIAEGVVVGFQLEQGFNADDGAEADSTKAFSRESRLYVKTDYGTLHLGRFGALDSGTGSVDIAAGFTASGTGYGTNILDQSRVMKTYSRLDNSIAYTSPEFAGVKVHAMASLGNDYTTTDAVTKEELTGAEGSSNVDRYYGLGVTGQWGDFGAGMVVSQVDRGSLQNPEYTDDATNVTASVNYDFGVAHAYLAANYYKGGEKLQAKHSDIIAEDYSQWGVVFNVSAPIASGTLETGIGYAVGTDDARATDDETKILNVGVMYKYPLSKRTYVYAGAGYDQVEDFDGEKIKTTEVISGLVHQF